MTRRCTRSRFHAVSMYPQGDDLPLFSGTPIHVPAQAYRPTERPGEQSRMFPTAPEMKGTPQTWHYFCQDCGQPCEITAPPGRPLDPYVSVCCRSYYGTEWENGDRTQ